MRANYGFTRSQDKISSENPEKALYIPDAAFDDAIGWTPELDALWQDVKEIYTEAAECDEHGQDENA